MGSTDGLRRGMTVETTGSPITVPVGEAMMACVLADHLLRFKSYQA